MCADNRACGVTHPLAAPATNVGKPSEASLHSHWVPVFPHVHPAQRNRATVTRKLTGRVPVIAASPGGHRDLLRRPFTCQNVSGPDCCPAPCTLPEVAYIFIAAK